jgi:hypothetical protein
VWRRGRRACADDRLEGDALGAALAEAALDPPGELALGAAGEALTRERFEDLVRESARAAHLLQLVGVLDRAEALDETRGRLCVDACIHELAVQGVRQVLLLEPDPPAREELADGGDEPACDLRDVDAVERAGATCVAEVRVEHGTAVRLDEHGRVRARETREVADVRLAPEHVGRAGHEQRLLEKRRESRDSGHASPFTRNSSASR